MVVAVAADNAEARRRGARRRGRWLCCRRADADNIIDAARAGGLAFGVALARGPRARGTEAASAGISLVGLARGSGCVGDARERETQAIYSLSNSCSAKTFLWEAPPKIGGANKKKKKKKLGPIPHTFLFPPPQRAFYSSLSPLELRERMNMLPSSSLAASSRLGAAAAAAAAPIPPLSFASTRRRSSPSPLAAAAAASASGLSSPLRRPDSPAATTACRASADGAFRSPSF